MRSMSGIGSISWWPYSRCATSWWGSWSTEVALNRLRVRQRLDHGPQVGHRAEAVDVRVAEVDADGVPAVVVAGRRPARRRPGRTPRPSRSPPTRSRRSQPCRDPAYGPAQPVGVVVHVRDRHALGADVPARERVGRVAAHRRDGAVVDGQLEAADRLTQVADADALLHGPIVSDPDAAGSPASHAALARRQPRHDPVPPEGPRPNSRPNRRRPQALIIFPGCP